MVKLSRRNSKSGQAIVDSLHRITYADYQDKVAMSQLQNYIAVLHSRYATSLHSYINVWQYVSRFVRPYQMASRVPIGIGAMPLCWETKEGAIDYASN